jgi:hypothetical protein
VVPLSQRGVHVLDPGAVPWEAMASGSALPVRSKVLMRPDNDVGFDRLPVTIIELPPGADLTSHANTENLLVNVLRGELSLGEDRIAAEGMACVDGGPVYRVAAGPTGATSF